MATKICKWKARDGKLFDVEIEAVQYDLKKHVLNLLREGFPCSEDDSGEYICSQYDLEDICSVIVDKQFRSRFITLLQMLEELNKRNK